jgi:hypothetical protein
MMARNFISALEQDVYPEKSIERTFGVVKEARNSPCPGDHWPTATLVFCS